MMQSPGFSLSWIVTFVIVIIIVGVLLGASMAGTDLFNFNASAAEMRAKDQATVALAERNAIDQKVYEARKQNELVKIEADTRAQQQAVAIQAAKNVIDQQAYRVQQMAQAMRQVADAKQYETQQLAAAETDRQRQLVQVEAQREQQLAQIRAAEQNEAQQRAEQAARAAEEVKWTNVFNTILAFAFILAAVAAAAGIIFGVVALAWPRLQRARLESATAKSETKPQITQAGGAEPMTQPKPIQTAEPGPAEATAAPGAERERQKQQRLQARAVEIATRTLELKQQQNAELTPVIACGPTDVKIKLKSRKNGKRPAVANEPEQLPKPDDRLC